MSLITFIRPCVLVSKTAPTTPIAPPIGLAYIAASAIQTGYKVKVVDAIGEAPDQFSEADHPDFLLQGLRFEEIISKIDSETKIFGISCMYSYEWPYIRNFINKLKSSFPDSKIIIGGEHASAMPGYCLQDCQALNYCVIGEGEETIKDLLRLDQYSSTELNKIAGIAFRDGKQITLTEPRIRITKVDKIPRPAWDLFPIENYLAEGRGRGVNKGRNMPIIATRGCPHSCTFCSNPSMWKTKWIPRSPQLVVDEIKHYIEKYNVNNFDFYDLTLVVNEKWTREFCNLIIENKLAISWQLSSGTRSEIISKEVSELLFKAGCTNISYAPESGSKKVLKRIKKKVDLKKLKQAINESEKNGIICKANIVFGFPQETHQELWKTFTFIIELGLTRLHDLSIYPFSPYPGSEIYNGMRDDGTICNINDDYFFDLARATSFNISQPSFSNNISDNALGAYRIVGIILFYLVSFTSKPTRIFQFIKHIFSPVQTTLLESVISDKLKSSKKQFATILKKYRTRRFTKHKASNNSKTEVHLNCSSILNKERR